MSEPYIPENALASVLRGTLGSESVANQANRGRIIEEYERQMSAYQSPALEALEEMRRQEEMVNAYREQAQQAQTELEGAFSIMADTPGLRVIGQIPQRLEALELTPAEAMERHSRDRDDAFQRLQTGVTTLRDRAGTDAALGALTRMIEENPDLAEHLNDDERYHEFVRGLAADRREGSAGLAGIAQGEAAEEVAALEAALESEDDPDRRAAIEAQIAETRGYAEDPTFGETEVPDIRNGLTDYVEQSRRYTGEQARYRYNRFVSMAVQLVRAPMEMGVGAIETADLLASPFLTYLLGVRNGEVDVDHPDNRLLDGLTTRLDAAINILAPADEARQEEFLVQLAGGAGSLMGFYMLGAMGVRGKWLAGAGAMMEGSSGWEAAYALNATAGQRYVQLFTHMGLGATEAIPIDAALGRMADMVGMDFFNRTLAQTAAGSMEEFLQELGQAAGSEFSLYWGLGDEVDWEQIRRQAAIGAITGAGAGMVQGAAADWMYRQQGGNVSAADIARATEILDRQREITAQTRVTPPQLTEAAGILDNTAMLLDVWNRESAPRRDAPVMPEDLEPGALPLLPNAPARVAESFQEILQPPPPMVEEGAEAATPEEEAAVERVPMGMLGELDAQIAQPILQAAEDVNRELAETGERQNPIVLPPEKLEFNLRQTVADREGTTRGYAPRERVVLQPPPGTNLPPVAIGDLTFEDWTAKSEALLDEEEIAASARWYETTLDVFRQLYPGNEGLAQNAMVAWLAGQVQQSPDGAAMDVLPQNQNAVEGREGADRLKNNTTPTSNNVLAAFKGEKLTGGVGAKIADFIDSGFGKTTRSWVGDDPRGGAPFVVDRHTARDTGIVDKPYEDALRRRGYTFPEGYKREVEKDVNANGRLYENRANWGRDLTDHLNETEWMGRSDWKPHEVQAVGWMATLRLMGNNLPTPTSAIEANTYNTAFEIDPGADSPAAAMFSERLGNLGVGARTRIMEAQGRAAIDLAKEYTSVMAATPITRGTGSWEGTVNPSATTGTFATRNQAQAFNAVPGFLTDQTAIMSYRGFPLKQSHTSFTIQLMFPPTTTRADHQRIFDIMRSRGPVGKDGEPMFAGFMPLSANGRDGFAMVVDAGTAKYAKELKKFLGLNPDLSPIEERSGLTGALGRAGFFDEGAVDIVVGGADIVFTENDWANGAAGYESAYREATGRPLPTELYSARADLHAQLARQLEAEEARQERSGRRRLAALAANSGSTPFAGPDGRVRLTHWSPSAHQLLDPSKAGTGPLIGEERRAGWKHVYFGAGVDRVDDGGYRRENTGQVRHEVTLDGSQLYNMSEDPLGLRDFFPEDRYTERQRLDGVNKMIGELGYLGFINPNHPRGAVVGLYRAVSPDTVVNERTGETVHRRDEIRTGDEEFDAMMISAPRTAPVVTRNFGRLPDRLRPYEIDDAQQQLPLVGDTTTTPFQQWFNGSWITDETGGPLLVHHGTWKPGFTSFRSDDGVAGWFSDELDTSVTYGRSAGNEGRPAFGADLRKLVENGQELRNGYFRYRFRRTDMQDYYDARAAQEQETLDAALQDKVRQLNAWAEVGGPITGPRARSLRAHAGRVARAIEQRSENWLDDLKDFSRAVPRELERQVILPDDILTLATRPAPDLPDRVRPILEQILSDDDASSAHSVAQYALTAIENSERFWHLDALEAVNRVFKYRDANPALLEELRRTPTATGDNGWDWSRSTPRQGTGYIMEIQSYAGPTFSQEQIEAARERTRDRLREAAREVINEGSGDTAVDAATEALDAGAKNWARQAIRALDVWLPDSAAKEEHLDLLSGMNSYLQAGDWTSALARPGSLRESIKAVRSLIGDAARGAGTYDAYLRITNPYVIDYEGRQWNNGPEAAAGTTVMVPIMGTAEETLQLISEVAPDLLQYSEGGKVSEYGNTTGQIRFENIPARDVPDLDNLRNLIESRNAEAHRAYSMRFLQEMARVEREMSDRLPAYLEKFKEERRAFVLETLREQGTPISDISAEQAAILERQTKAQEDFIRTAMTSMPLSQIANYLEEGAHGAMVAQLVTGTGTNLRPYLIFAMEQLSGTPPGIVQASDDTQAMSGFLRMIRDRVGPQPATRGLSVDERSFDRNTRAHVELARELGHDGVIFRNIRDTAQGEAAEPANVFVAFEATQIKAAGANMGTYSLEDPDILAMAAQPPQAPQGLGASSTRAPYVGEPTRPTGGIPSGAQNVQTDDQNSLQEIAQAFRRAMRITVNQGRLTLRGAGVQGQYSRKQGTIRLHNLRDVSTLFHEGGHALHDAMDGPLRGIVRQNASELLWMADNVYAGDLQGQPKDKRIREGFAEAFRVFVQNRAMLAQWAPGFAQSFEQLLQTEDAQLLEQLNAIGEMYRNWTKTPSVDHFRNMIAEVKEPSVIRETGEMAKEVGVKEASRSILRAKTNHFLSEWVNNLTGLNTLTARLLNAAEANRGGVPNLLASQDPAKLATMAQNFTGRALGFMTDGVRRFHSEDIISRPLSDALDLSQGREAGKNGGIDPIRRKDFAAYVMALRSLDEAQRGAIDRFAINSDAREAQLVVTEMEAKYGAAFREAADVMHEYGMALWDRMHDAGLLTTEQWQEQRNRGFYVPLMRDMSDKAGDIGSMLRRLTNSGGELTKVVHQLRGSDRQVIDPMQALIQKTISIEQMIAQNEIRQALARLADMGGRHAGPLVERVPAYDPKVTTTAVADIVKRLTKSDDVTPTEALEMQIALQPYVDADSELSFFRMETTSAKGDPIVFLREKGKVVALQINDQETAGDVVNALNVFGAEDKWDAPGILNLFTQAARVFRAGITSWPDFIVVNFVRDQVQAFVSTSEGYTPFTSGLKGMGNELLQRDMARNYNYYGGIMGGAGQAQYNEARIAADLNVLRGRGYVTRTVRHDAPGFLSSLTRVTEVSETGTRLGLFEKAYARAKAEGLSDYDAGVEASYVATDYMNYGLHGSKTIALRRLIPFLNANIVGLTKMWRVLGNTEVARRKGFAFAMTSYLKSVDNLPLTNAEKTAVVTGRRAWIKMMSLGLISLLLTRLFEDDEDYQQTSPYLRQTGWIVPLNGEIIYIPKPFEWALFANAVERGLEYSGGDELAWQRFWRATRESMQLPTDNPLLATYQQIRNNYDPFFERQLIPTWMQAEVAADASLGVNAYTSQLARDIGGVLDVPPIYVDHALQNMGASMARDISTVYDQAFSPVDQELSRNDAPILRRFFRDSSRGSVIVQDFWDEFSGTDGGLTGAASAYDAWIAERGPEGARERAEQMLDEPQRLFAYLNEHFTASEKRLHPMRWARDYSSVLRSMRDDIRSPLGLADTSDDLGRIIDLTPSQRTELQALLSDLGVRVTRNALIEMDHPTWTSRERGDLTGTFDMIREISPETADELERRLRDGRVYSEDAIRDLWPEAQERLRFDGPDAFLEDLSSMARSW